MLKKVISGGILGGVMMLIWLVMSNAMLPYKSRMIHMIAPNQLDIHEELREHITEPGTYSIPCLSPAEEHLLPEYRDQPVYSVTYEGFTHGTGSPLSPYPFIIIFAVPLAAAWMLSATDHRILSRYYRRFLFVVLIGAIVALFDDVLQMSFGPQPKNYLIFLAVNNIITWVLAGLVIAWRVKPVIRSSDNQVNHKSH